MFSFAIQQNKLIFTAIAIFLILITSCKPEIEEIKTDSSYINEVFDYVYAPGQHANMAKKTDGDLFTGNPFDNLDFVYLGGFGGYIIAGFDHNISNHERADFEVFALKGASPEPAIVYVMPDKNTDGKPNDTWYELKGNQHENSIRNYWVRYYKPANQASNISWLDSDGKRGELISGYGGSISFAWWWGATLTDSITLKGTRLPDAYTNEAVNGNQLWSVPTDRFTWGYAENNFGTDYDLASGSNKLDISNAIDSVGNTIYLPNIRFIKIQTAVFQQAGWTNEVSAEIRGAREIK
jgi:hypothetical protein